MNEEQFFYDLLDKTRKTFQESSTFIKHGDKNWNFVSHSRKYFRDYFDKEIEELNYSNLCFFRSPKVKQIENEDWELAIPLFQKYVNYIDTPWTLMLGKPNHLWKNYLFDRKTITIRDTKNGKSVYGYTGMLFDKYPFSAVPHPQAKISSETQVEVWDQVVKGKNNFRI